jgi:hypothetical protein
LRTYQSMKSACALNKHKIASTNPLPYVALRKNHVSRHLLRRA